MTDAGLSPKLVEFIHPHLPIYALVDALILLSRNATTHWTRQQLTHVLLPIAAFVSFTGTRPAAVTRALVES